MKLLAALLFAVALIAQDDAAFAVEKLTPAEVTAYNEALTKARVAQGALDMVASAIKKAHGQTPPTGEGMIGGLSCYPRPVRTVEIKGEYALIDRSTLSSCTAAAVNVGAVGSLKPVEQFPTGSIVALGPADSLTNQTLASGRTMEEIDLALTKAARVPDHTLYEIDCDAKGLCQFTFYDKAHTVLWCDKGGTCSLNQRAVSVPSQPIHLGSSVAQDCRVLTGPNGSLVNDSPCTCYFTIGDSYVCQDPKAATSINAISGTLALLPAR